ncbi:hypothetical protein [Nonomuraea jiangxiensis]|nr:hypothetical protein [Nonomuraea jiangxiensis]
MFDYFRLLGRIAQGLDAPESLLPEQDRFDVHFVDGGTRWSSMRAGVS